MIEKEAFEFINKVIRIDSREDFINIIINNISSFDETFFSVLNALIIHGEQQGNPGLSSLFRDLYRNLKDANSRYLILIQELVSSDDWRWRKSLCLRHANFMSAEFFSCWQKKVIDLYRREKDRAKEKLATVRFNESLGYVKEICTEINQNMIPVFKSLQTNNSNYKKKRDSYYIINTEISFAKDGMSASDYRNYLQTLVEDRRSFPVFSKEHYQEFKGIEKEFGFPSSLDMELKEFESTLGEAFASEGHPEGDPLLIDLWLYKNMMLENRRKKVKHVLIVELPINQINAAGIKAPSGEPLVVVDAGILHMLWGINRAIASSIASAIEGETVAEMALRIAPKIKLILQGQAPKLPEIKIDSKSRLYDLSVKSFLGIYQLQQLFIIGHELEHIANGNLEYRKPGNTISRNILNEFEFLTSSREDEFEADRKAIETLLESGIGNGYANPMTAIDILFQYVEIMEDYLESYLPSLPTHPIAVERRMALRKQWITDIMDKKVTFLLHIVSVFMMNINKFLENDSS